MKAMKEEIQKNFMSLFGESGELFTSAGRINLIGEHTDYNGGYVFPGAINKGIMAEIKVNGTSKVKAYSLDYEEYVEFGLGENDAPEQNWARYRLASVARSSAEAAG